MKQIVIKGAREHNLKNISVSIPRDSFVVITGLSGSGKSSLAFDTLYTEGQRRYIESFSSYARQFLEKMKKADVDYISGLSPSISIEQRQMNRNPRSTVGTVTEIYDYLRLLFAKVGDVFCYKCGRPVGGQTRKDIVKQVMAMDNDKPIMVLAPLVRGRKGEYKELLLSVKKKGYTKVRIDGTMYDLSDSIKLRKNKKHVIDVIIDHVRLTTANKKRIEESINDSLTLSEGYCSVFSETGNSELLFSEKMTCVYCNISFNEFTPNMFSFNSPYGACATCHGLGKVSQIIRSFVIKDASKPLLKGGLNAELDFSFNRYFIEDLVYELGREFSLDMNKIAYKDLPEEVQDAFFWGNDEVNGLLDELRELFHTTSSENIKRKLRLFLEESVCQECHGKRLKKEAMGVTVDGKNIVDLCDMSLEKAKQFFDMLELKGFKEVIASTILKEIRERLSFLINVGVGYLSLSRNIATLGGGEFQRIKLASQIGVGLSGVLYVLDEPSIGLHPRDNNKLLDALISLRDLQNTVVVVEHDEDTMRKADYIVDLGPEAGKNGGRIMGKGTLKTFLRCADSLTAQYLQGKKKIPVPSNRKAYRGVEHLWIKGAREHNLKNIDVGIPLGLFTCITGVSGSGKSTLLHDTLYKALHNTMWRTNYSVGQHSSLVGAQHISRVIEIDQSPIGRTPRSNPATYIDLFSSIRKIFAELPESRMRSYSASRFSFNLKGGRCETCRGEGYQKLEMSFLPDVYVVCDVCEGKRYNEQTLEILFKEKTINDILNLSVAEARVFFSAYPVIKEKLQILVEVGLSYLKLGQPSTTLSGGEAQRIKLATELGKRTKTNALYLLDEPTTGLHFHDVNNLMKALMNLRDCGNTIVVIEHNMEVVKMADYIIDLGPEGGDGGGNIVVQGSPEDIIRSNTSHTARFLKNYLK